MRRPPQPQSFEKFYYTKVGLGEGCCCAEKIIDNHEMDRIFEARKHRRENPGPLTRLWRKLRERSPTV